MKRPHLALVVALTLLAGCADRVVQLRYEPDSQIARLSSTQGVTVFRVADARGSEGDGDPRRVGGIYGGYGNRVAKVMASWPWPETLVRALTTGFEQRGVQAVPVQDKEYARANTTVSTPLVLAGEIRNFSTDVRWTLQSHVSGIVRLYDQRGTLLLEKPISARVKEPFAGNFETMLNDALAQFVRAVVTDPEITQRLVATR